MEVKSYFSDFIRNIKLTDSQIQDLKTGHTTLRDRLSQDEELSKVIVTTFLQGSYRRSTAVRPKGDSRSDVDVIVVTKLSQDEYTPDEALELFIPFLERHYKGKYRKQGRSLGITLSYVDLDLVVTSAPSESEEGLLKSESVVTDFSLEEAHDWKLIKSWLAPNHRGSRDLVKLSEQFVKEAEWKLSPLYIPDRDAEEWTPTHPLAQIQWSRDKNSRCNGHYVNVVKAIKWWQRLHRPDAKPKSYLLEHFVGVCCPDDITSVAQGVTETFETVVNSYKTKPYLSDHGVEEHDVFGRVTDEEYEEFYNHVVKAAEVARAALDSETVSESVELWRELFGTKFPSPPTSSKNGFTQRIEKSEVSGGRFA